MPKITLSDGRVLDVPDALTPAQMEETLRKHLLPPAPAAPAPPMEPEFVEDDVPAEARLDFFDRRKKPKLLYSYESGKALAWRSFHPRWRKP